MAKRKGACLGFTRFRKQVMTLMGKNLRRLLLRHPVTVVVMSFLLPITLAAFFSFAKNLFVPPSVYGVGTPHPVLTLPQAFDAARGSDRTRVVLINGGGGRGGDMERVLDAVARQTLAYGRPMHVVRLAGEAELVSECRSSLRGVTGCFGAVVMRASPSEGRGGIWNYTIRTDASLYESPLRIHVDSARNPEEIYLLPLQRTVDAVIARLDARADADADADARAGADIDAGDAVAASPLARSAELPFTSQTQRERDQRVRQLYHSTIVNFMGIAFISTIIWVTYHLTGFVATERESGMSQLIDSMMTPPKPWVARAARIVSHHLSFTIVYAPAWVIGSCIIRYGVFVNTTLVIVLVFHVLAGLSLSSLSILCAAFFRKAQLSSITAMLATLLLGILAQCVTAPGTATVAVLSGLFSPCNYVYFITLMARFEKQDRSASLRSLPPGSPWAIPGYVFWVLLLVQIVAYPLMAAFVEGWLYATSTKGRHVVMDKGKDSSLGGDAVRLDGFTKIYNPGLLPRIRALFERPRQRTQAVVAVDGLTLNAGKGQIVALLGANGSGKSTTLDAIAGLQRLTSGSITIDGTGGLGIAPQKNVLWDDLSVEEHISIFNRLKSPERPATEGQLTRLIKSIDLESKQKSLAKTLSGGQKRKLQLGMMLTGESAVCCVDEVSSGLDPLSRRKIWDILLAERGKRTMILTTHFLDEADLLADHIAILSKGSLRAAGSSVALKDKLGGGYRVHVHKGTGLRLTPDVEGVLKKETFDSTTYVAPTSSLAAQVIRELEAVGTVDYRFSGPTIEDVFLQLADEIREDETSTSIGAEGEAADQVTEANSAEQRATEKKNEVGHRVTETNEAGQRVREKSSAGHEVTETNEAGRQVAANGGARDDDDSSHGGEQDSLKLTDGKAIGYAAQVAILLQKRATVFKRNWVPYVLALALPVVAGGLTSLYVRGRGPMGCSAAEQSSTGDPEEAFGQIMRNRSILFLAGPAARFNGSGMGRLLGPILAGSPSGAAIGRAALNNVRLVDTYDGFQRFIADHRANLTTGLWLGDDDSPPTVGWVGNLFVTSALTAQQFLDVLLTNTAIATTWSPFDVPFNPGVGDALNLVIYMGIALACYPALLGLYPSSERRRLVRALQYSNGVRPLPLWAAYLVFDMAIVVAASALVTGLWAALSSIWYRLEYVFAVLFLYGLASTLLAYVVSLFAKTQLSSFAWAAAYQVAIFLGYLVAYVYTMTYVRVSRIDSTILACHFAISALAPIGSAIRALFISTNLFSTACDGQAVSRRPGSLLMYGGPVAYLVVQSLALFALLLWFDSGSSVRSLLERRRQPDAEAAEPDEDVAREVVRVTGPGGARDGLRVVHLTKAFGGTTAVDNVSFGIQRGEVFALLGPNGAGKSTTVSLVRGDVKPSRRGGGDVFVEDTSVTKSLAAARTHMGVCPQTDALDQMTVREHLEFYARVRGVADVEHNVSAVLRAVGLDSFEARMAHTLSGGNRRKLSLGIALMGNPTVVLLDEPSSGLDAASKRVMWRTLAATVPGRSILLTTHSMEEADALAGRAGILARRMLALGTPDGLRRRFGDTLHVHLVSSTAPRTSDADMDRISSWVRATFPDAVLDSKTYHGQMRFSVRARHVAVSPAQQPPASPPASETSAEDAAAVPDAPETKPAGPAMPADAAAGPSGSHGSAMGQLIVLLEEHKEQLGVEHYSVSPTTLDQVFLAIVGKHDVREENSDARRGLWCRIRRALGL